MADTQPQDSRDASTPAPEEPAKAGRKRPRIDMATDAGQRKRGKSMFALALGTLTKAKNEDRARNQSEAVRSAFVLQIETGFANGSWQAKKRQEIEQRLQEKLRKETDSVRRAEEAKKDKTAANRKEEELQLKDSIVRIPSPHYVTSVAFSSTLSDPSPVQTTPDTSPCPRQLPSHLRQHPRRPTRRPRTFFRLPATRARDPHQRRRHRPRTRRREQEPLLGNCTRLKSPRAHRPTALSPTATVLPPRDPHTGPGGIHQAEKRGGASVDIRICRWERYD